MAAARRGVLVVDGQRLVTWRWGVGRPVLLMHGWGGRAAQMTGFVEPILAAGLSAVAVDAPAHGLSEGRFSSVPRFAAALAALTRQRPAGLIAHSLGAAAGGLALARGLSPDRVVFVSPSAWPGHYFDGFLGSIGVKGETLARARATVEARLGLPFDEIELPRLPLEKQAPALIIHDSRDREVPFAHGAGIAATWPGADLIATEGLGHRRILGDPDVIARSVRFLAAGAARCEGCGAGVGHTTSGTARCETCLLEMALFAPHSRAA